MRLKIAVNREIFIIRKTMCVMLSFILFFIFHTHSAKADDKSGSFFCQSGIPCTMNLVSVYSGEGGGHSVASSYDYDITASKQGDLQVSNNSVTSDITYTLSDGTYSKADGLIILLNDATTRYYPTTRPASNLKVKTLSETVHATFTNLSSEKKSGSVTIQHRYGHNNDTFTYNVTVTPPPPVCTTTISSASISMGIFTKSQLINLSPGQSTGKSQSVRVTSQCSYSPGVNITIKTNRVTADGYLAAGGGINFLPEIDGNDEKFGSNGELSFAVSTAIHSFDFGITVVRSDEKPVAGTYKNIITITTTPV